MICLVTVARMNGIPADYNQLKRAFSPSEKPIDTMTLVRAAKQINLKAKETITTINKLTKLPLPAIAILNNGTYIVLF